MADTTPTAAHTLSATKPATIVITLRQAYKLVEFFGGHDASVTVTSPAPDWEQQMPGLYAYCTEYPEDGAQYLGPTEIDDELTRLDARGAQARAALTGATAPAQAAPSEQDERALFESAMTDKLCAEQGEFAMSRAHNDGNPYTFLATRWAWQAWQVARAAQGASGAQGEPTGATGAAGGELNEAWAADLLGVGGVLSKESKERISLILLGARNARAAASQAAPGVATEPVAAWANWKVGTDSYVPFKTREQATASVQRSEIAATQEGPYEVVPLIHRLPAPAAATGSDDARDAARLDFMAEHEAWIAWGRDHERCRLFIRAEDGDARPMMGWNHMGAWQEDPRDAIDAAMSGHDSANGGERSGE